MLCAALERLRAEVVELEEDKDSLDATLKTVQEELTVSRSETAEEARLANFRVEGVQQRLTAVTNSRTELREHVSVLEARLETLENDRSTDAALRDEIGELQAQNSRLTAAKEAVLAKW